MAVNQKVSLTRKSGKPQADGLFKLIEANPFCKSSLTFLLTPVNLCACIHSWFFALNLREGVYAFLWNLMLLHLTFFFIRWDFASVFILSLASNLMHLFPLVQIYRFFFFCLFNRRDKNAFFDYSLSWLPCFLFSYICCQIYWLYGHYILCLHPFYLFSSWSSVVRLSQTSFH